LQRLLAEARERKRSRPFIDFDHQGKEAAAIPVKFIWDEGIRLEVEWTSAGREAIAGRTYSYFSPEFILGDVSKLFRRPVPSARW
jgi:phage I-like protein